MATLAKDDATLVRPPAPTVLQLRRILCPVDFSPLSGLAIDRATQIAHATGAEITALFVAPVDALASDGEAGARTTIAKDAESFLAPARAAGARVSLALAAGDPASGILAACAWAQPDLIVMGTHGRTGPQRWLLGSVAQAVLRDAACPVLTVAEARRDEHAAVAREGGGIVCAVELGDGSAHTLAYAVALGRQLGLGVTVLHVLENMAPYQAAALCSRVDWPAFCRDIEQSARERLERAVAGAGGAGVVTNVVVATGKPYREVLRLAAERDAALIVMGIHGRTQPQLRFFGSNAEHVVREAKCPVLTVHGC